ncbi:MAG: hypothetical protein J6M10_10295 [Clostridia bacterium]|nr:hypothetical protein [Clostridia bacterium]
MNEHDFMELKTKVDEQTAANRAEHASFKRRLDSLEEAGKERTEMLLAIQRLGDAQEAVAEKVAGIATSVDGVEKRLDKIEKEPGEETKKLRFEIIKYIVLAVLGVFVGYFLK